MNITELYTGRRTKAVRKKHAFQIREREYSNGFGFIYEIYFCQGVTTRVVSGREVPVCNTRCLTSNDFPLVWQTTLQTLEEYIKKNNQDMDLDADVDINTEHIYFYTEEEAQVFLQSLCNWLIEYRPELFNER